MWTDGNMKKVSLSVAKAEHEAGNDVGLNFEDGRMRYFINLSSLTYEELIAHKRVIDTAFELAAPVSRERDEYAEAALEDGDTSYPRCFRPPPIVWKREGPAFLETIETLPDTCSLDSNEASYLDRVVQTRDTSNKEVDVSDEAGSYGEE